MDNVSKIIELQKQCNQLFTNVDVKGYQTKTSEKFNLLDTKDIHLFNINQNDLAPNKLEQYYLLFIFRIYKKSNRFYAR